MREVRSPKEILDLYRRLKKRKGGQGKTYRKKDFCRDIGYTHQSRFQEITTGKWKISPAVNRLMDFLEDSL